MLNELYLGALALSASGTVLALPTGGDQGPDVSKLSWTPCNLSLGIAQWMFPPQYPYQCANLSVPLDYTDTDSSEELVLNLVRVEALNKPAKGSILFNPGGPGGSGVEFVTTRSDLFHEVLEGNYNLIGFDPRGTGKTIPFNCNLTDRSEPIQARDLPEVTIQRDVDEVIEEYWPENLEMAAECSEKMNETGSLIGTAFVARDMLQIVDALDEDGLLHYWGISYGTYLGATFASMFPDRVGRVLLDANVNLHDFQSGHEYDRMIDTDKAFLGYLRECAANPDKCAIARHAASSDVEDLLAFYNSMKPLMDAGGDDPSWWFDWDLFKTLTVSLLYDPASWGNVGNDMLENMINQTLGIESDESDDNSSSNSTTPDPDPEDLIPWNEGINAAWGIGCGDNTWRISTPDELLPVAQRHFQTSSFADVGFPARIWACGVWKMRAKEIYSGDFTAQTKNPIMLVNGIYDPVTPWASAVNTSAGFEGSALLKHKGFGHGVMSHPSLCTGHAIRRFFDDGTLPEEGTECEPDVRPFELPNPLEHILPSVGMKRRSLEGEMTEADVRLYEAMREMGKRDSEMRKRGQMGWL